MKKSAFAFALAAAMACSAHADGVIPAGTMLGSHISLFGSHAVKAKIEAPAKIQNTWDEIAARYAGCTAEGEHGEPDHATQRTYMKFEVLKCDGKRAVAVHAIGVSPVDARVGLKTPAGVKSETNILLMDNATTP